MKKITLYALLLMTFILSSTEAFASKLPDDVWEYIKKEIPGATQRFDSVVTVTKDVMYVPLYPAQKERVDELKVEYTYPQVKSLRQLPEVLIFNNNFVLMKIFKNKNGNFTLTAYQEVPMKVKLGIMPQDMLVPVGLIVPENLKLILGDLNIPTKSDNTIAVDKEGAEANLAALNNTGFGNDAGFQPLRELKNKKMFITSSGSKFVMVYDNESKNPLYELKLNALPAKILASNSTKFALVVYFSHKNIEIIDLQNERIVSQIPIEDVAKDADIDLVGNIAYVSAPSVNSIYVVDLNSAKLTKTIKLAQSPGKVTVSNDGTMLAFIDNLSQDLCYMELSDEYTVRRVAQAPNVSKIIFDNDKIYAVSRVKNKLDIYNIYTGTLLSTEKVSRKPVDAILRNNKIYILCAQDAVIDIYDTKKEQMVKSVKIGGGGFYSKITPVPNQQNALLTGVGTGKCLVFDLEDMKVTKIQPFEVQVSNIVIVDK